VSEPLTDDCKGTKHDANYPSDSTYNFVDSALQAGVNKIDNIANGVDGWFLKMENYIRTATMPEQLASTRMANAASTSDATDNEEAARVGWTKYQLGHGGAAKNSQVVAGTSSRPRDHHYAMTNLQCR